MPTNGVAARPGKDQEPSAPVSAASEVAPPIPRRKYLPYPFNPKAIRLPHGKVFVPALPGERDSEGHKICGTSKYADRVTPEEWDRVEAMTADECDELGIPQLRRPTVSPPPIAPPKSEVAPPGSGNRESVAVNRPSAADEDLFGPVMTPGSEAGRGRARKLRDAAVAAGITQPYSESKWAKTFDRLAVEVGDTRLDAALDYHCGTVARREEYALEIYSADGFRTRFADVERKLDRDRKRGKAPIPSDPAADELIRKVVADECDGSAPPGLADAIKLSWANHTAWLAKLDAAAVRPGARNSLSELRGEFYLRRWFRDAWKKNRRWKDWSGNWAGDVWKDDHPRFVAEADRELRQYGVIPEKFLETVRNTAIPGA